MKILVVEDSATLRFTMSGFIKHAGHEAIVAESGEQALQIIETTAVDLVIMDVEMPGLNGFETTRLMREAFDGNWVPIIFVTGMTDDASYSEGIESGGDDYLTKPISPVILKAKIRALERITAMQKELERLNLELQVLSQRDSLTNLYNRRAFEELACTQWKVQSRCKQHIAILMVDVDYFKPYNDHYGHQLGDDCLQAIASALRESLHRPADCVARFGGEEFIVMLPDTDEQGAKLVGETLRAAVEALQIPHEKSKVNSVITISVGGASTDQPASISLHELTKHADRALYESKGAGRNYVSMVQVHAHKTVLVMDDDQATLDMIDLQLHDYCNILTTDNANDCIEIAHNVLPDLILLEPNMAGVSTDDVCNQLKTNQRTSAIPVLLMSSKKRPSEQDKRRLALANGSVEKPLNEKTLRDKVSQYLR